MVRAKEKRRRRRRRDETDDDDHDHDREKKKKKMKTTTTTMVVVVEVRYMPEDMMTEILLRLPEKSIIRLRLVSKRMYHLISTREFIISHLKTPSRRCDFALYNHWWRFVRRCSKSDKVFSRTIDCCDGVVCRICRIENVYMVQVYNPSIRKYMNIPTLRSNLYLKKSSSPRFGFGCVDGECKMVVIPNTYRKGTILKVNVCSSKTGKWTTIECSWTSSDPQHKQVGRSAFEWKVVEQQSVFLNGACHWLAVEREGGPPAYFVLTFNLVKGTFGKIVAPAYLGPAKDHHVKYFHKVDTFVYQGCLSLIATTSCHVGKFVMWVMKEYGTVESWSRTIESVDLSGVEVIVGFCERGDIMYGRKGRKEHLVGYDPITRRIWSWKNTYRVSPHCRLHNNRGSLVLLDQGSLTY